MHVCNSVELLAGEQNGDGASAISSIPTPRCSFKEAEVDVVIKGKGKVKVNASEDYICVRSLCLDALTRWHTWWQQD